MAIMIPDLELRDISNDGERDVYKSLKENLPDDWYVRYSYASTWLRNGCLQDSEVDFIIVAPRFGLMFLEVKASRGYKCENGKWFRQDKYGQYHEVQISPFEQAKRAKHNVVKRIAEKVFKVHKNEFPGLWGHAVVYPRAKKRGRLCESTDPQVIITYDDMSEISQKIHEAFDAWEGESNNRSEYKKKFKEFNANEVVKFLKDECRFIYTPAVSAAEDEEIIDELTLEQYEFFRKSLSSNRIRIKGTAGSGKTLIAHRIANQKAKEGKKVLLVCYNKVLGQWLEDLPKDEKFEIRTVFSLFKEVAGKAHQQVKQEPHRILEAESLEWRSPQGSVSKKERDLFWNQKVPNMVLESVDELNNKVKYDVIIVDEGQDFADAWWDPIEYLLLDEEESSLFIFFDPEQILYEGDNRGKSFPSKMETFELNENCRNTKKITKYSSNVIEKEINTLPTLPVGTIPQINPSIENVTHRAKSLKKVINELLVDFLPSDIAILSQYKNNNDKCSYALINSVNNVPLESGDENKIDKWKSNEIIWCSTIKSFKGLEATCVVVTDIDYAIKRNDLYVAITRAKHRLILLPSMDENYVELTDWRNSIE